jgi:hypothetical protein
LVDLLTDLEGVSLTIGAGRALPAFDYHCPTMSLPLALKTTLKTVPATEKYLHIDEKRITQWRSRLPPRGRARVGLVWSGNANNWIDARRRILLSDWTQYLPSGFDYYSLQKDVREEDKATLESGTMIRYFNEERDFVDTSALCECMDIVISVDTSVAHLSAALGRRTWILLPVVPDWRWMRERDDSPWYPTVRLYRQQVAGNWHGVFARLAADLISEFPAE